MTKHLPLIIFFLLIFGPALGKNFLPILILGVTVYFLVKKDKYREFSFFNNLKNNLNSSLNNNFNNNKSNVINLDNLNFMKHTKKFIFSISLMIFGVWLFFASIYVVDAGETGVYSLFGKVKDQELSSGFHLVIPFAKVTQMSIRTEEYTMSKVHDEGKKIGADAISALTKEGLTVELDMTVLFKLEEEKAAELYENVGLDYVEKILRPSIRTSIRDIIAGYEAKDIYSEKRQEASAKILHNLKKELGERGIIVEEVLLRDVVLPIKLKNAIEGKLEAEQEAEKYDFLLAKEKKEKERKIIEAEGQRDAQKIINESLSENYLYYLYINQLKDRKGTIYIPTGSTTGMPLFKSVGN